LSICSDFATLGDAPPVLPPTLTRSVALIAVALAAALLAAPAGARERPAPVEVMRSSSGPSLADAVRVRINAVRQSQGLTALRAAPALGRSARAHARSMVQRGYFGHDSSDGASAADRIRRYYPGSWVGETLLWRSPGVNAQQVVGLWLNSPPHRRVLLHPEFRHIGIGIVRASAAPGAFGGRDVTVVVADFGAP
jgi:uncharacterized protein YkwD